MNLAPEFRVFHMLRSAKSWKDWMALLQQYYFQEKYPFHYGTLNEALKIKSNFPINPELLSNCLCSLTRQIKCCHLSYRSRNEPNEPHVLKNKRQHLTKVYHHWKKHQNDKQINSMKQINMCKYYMNYLESISKWYQTISPTQWLKVPFNLCQMTEKRMRQTNPKFSNFLIAWEIYCLFYYNESNRAVDSCVGCVQRNFTA